MLAGAGDGGKDKEFDFLLCGLFFYSGFEDILLQT